MNRGEPMRVQAFLLIGIIFLAGANPLAAGWSGQRGLGPSAWEGPVIDASGPNVHIARIVYFSSTLRFIQTAHSSDCGATWSLRGVGSADGAATPRLPLFLDIASIGEEVFLVWTEDHREDQRDQIFFSHSSDRGATWTPKRQISRNDRLNGPPSIAVAGRNVYIAWAEGNRKLERRRESQARIMVSVSRDLGGSWRLRRATAKTRIHRGALRFTKPVVVAARDRLHLAWNRQRSGALCCGDDIVYQSADPAGRRWTEPERVNHRTEPSDRHRPGAILVSGDRVDLLWQSARRAHPRRVHHSRRLEDRSWSTPKVVNPLESESNPNVLPVLAGADGVLWATWQTGRNATFEGGVVVARSADGGVTWPLTERIGGRRNGMPAIAISGPGDEACRGTAHLAYSRWLGKSPGLWYRRYR